MLIESISFYPFIIIFFQKAAIDCETDPCHLKWYVDKDNSLLPGSFSYLRCANAQFWPKPQDLTYCGEQPTQPTTIASTQSTITTDVNASSSTTLAPDGVSNTLKKF